MRGMIGHESGIRIDERDDKTRKWDNRMEERDHRAGKWYRRIG